MAGCKPPAVVSLLERCRNDRESDLQGSGELDGRLVPELAGHTVVVDCVLIEADGRGDCGAGDRQRQDDDPGAPAGAKSCGPVVHGSSLSHHFLRLAQIASERREKGGSERISSKC